MNKRTRRNVRRSKIHKKKSRKQRGGASLPIPRRSVAVMSLDPKNIYGVPVVVSKELAEDQILEN